MFKITDFPRGAVEELKSVEFRSLDRQAIWPQGKHVLFTDEKQIKI